jgi:cytochrome d ubiquinol oxidase subunit I
MIDPDVVLLSRWQFAATALYHFLFVPLTLGLGFLLAAMETVYVLGGREVHRRMVEFWSKLFLVNFALGVATGLTLEFEFGTNWSYYSGFVGDIFGAPLAIEALMAFFLESTFIGLMVFGWKRLSRMQHLVVTYLVALGANLSALWILVGNAFMQDPQGARFNPLTMRMELASLPALLFSEEAQAKFVHTSLAGYVTAAVYVMGISAWYMLRGRHLELARRSFRVATVFGLLATAGVITLGDALGFVGGHAQPAKLAAMEAAWTTEPAPAPFNVVAWPDQARQDNRFALRIPYVLTPLVTHTLDQPVVGARDIAAANEQRVRDGLLAVSALRRLAADPRDAQALDAFERHQRDLGFGLLAQRYAPDGDPARLGPADLRRAALDSLPDVFAVFWSFRLMVAIALALFAYFMLALLYTLRDQVQHRRWFLRLAPLMIPLPFLASEFGWLTAELGRQPWTVYELLPTWMSASGHTVGELAFSLAVFAALYTAFLVIDVLLQLRLVRSGPHEGDAATPLRGAH